MPRKLPSAYVRKLNQEQKQAKTTAAKKAAVRKDPVDPDAGRLKETIMICQNCGTRATFTMDEQGYATCGNCRSIASYRFGRPA